MPRHPHVPRTPTPLRAVFVLWSAVFLALTTALPSAQAQTDVLAPQLFAFPAEIAPHGDLQVSGYGFPGSTGILLGLVCRGGAIDAGSGMSDASGRLRTSITIPLLDPGPCTLNASTGRTVLASAAVNILPAVQVVFSPDTAPPGAVVSFTVDNLVSGELRLDYAGRSVFGPSAVDAGSFTGEFVVPGDRPDPLGEPAVIRASNLVLGHVTGAAEDIFMSQGGSIPPMFQVVDLRLPDAAIPAGSEFTLRGRLNPAPVGPLDAYQIIPIWRKADGQTLPIGRGAAQILADGSFSVDARVPSLAAGDPTWPETGDQVGVSVFAPGAGSAAFTQPAAVPWSITPLKVIVRDAQTKNLITGAKVTLQVWDMTVSAGSLNQVAAKASTGAVNQVTQVLTGPELTEDEKLQIAMEKAMCIPLAIPVGQTEWEVTNPSLDEALSQPTLEGQYQGGTIIGQQAAGSAPSGAAASAAPDAAPHAAGVINYLLTVDAVDAGYGLKDADGSIKTLSLRIDYNWLDHTYRRTDGTILPNPLTVELTKLSTGDLSALGPIKVFMTGIGAPVQPQPASLPLFGVYYSVASVPAGVTINRYGNGGVVVTLSTDQQHKLGPGGMLLYLDGVQIAPFDIEFRSGLTCNKFKGTSGTSLPFYEAKAVIPNAHLLAPGVHSLNVQAQLPGGQWVTYKHQLKVDPVPASWFAIPVKGTRTLNWFPAKVQLMNPWLKPDTDTQLLSSGAETDETGPLDNRTRPSVTFTQSAEANGHKGGQTTGSMNGQVINRDGSGCSLSNCPANTAPPPGWGAAAAAAPEAAAEAAPQANVVASHAYGPRKEEVVPEVKYNIPGFTAGIPFVAAVEAGGVGKYSASVTYGGEVSVYDDGSIRAKARIFPVATVGAGIYISGYILGGLVAAGKIELIAGLDVGMPVTYDTQTGLDMGKTCFQYWSDLVTWSGYGCVPFTDICAYSDSDTDNLFNGRQPSGCAIPPHAAAAARPAAAAPAAAPSIGHLALASNGHGKVMAIWQGTRTSLAASVFDGKTWSAAPSIPTGVGATQPQAAFLTPNAAVAVWTETNLTEGALPGQTSTTMIHAQRIAFATWNGAAWSTPQPLTLPGLGEGGPALAGCPEWQSGCPAGGAAVAVWERNLSPDFAARQIRLYYSIFQGGVWSPVQPLDPASTFTDILPSVAYVNGTPLVAWVRDSDATMTELTSRRIGLRFLNGGDVFAPAELPGAIAEVALAVDAAGSPVLAFTRFEEVTKLFSNQRPLWAAAVSCSAPAVCTWLPQELHDAAGRTLYAERPLLAADLGGKIRITFRGLGFGGGLPGQPTDPPGMTSGVGELAHGVIDFATGHLTPKYLTQDGAVNWLPSQAYDPLLDAVLSTAVKGSVMTGVAGGPAAAAAGPPATGAGAPVLASPAPGLPIVAVAGPNQIDFVLVDATLAGGPVSGEPLQLTVRVENAGAPWTPGFDAPLMIAAAWDAAPGNGAPAGSTLLGALEPGGFAETSFLLAPPPAGLDTVHALHVVVNPGLVIPEAGGANNRRVLQAGGIAAPNGLWTEVQTGSALVFLGWDAVADRRVAGYRVYRTNSRGVQEPIGSSFAPGYVDLNTAAGAINRYVVTAYTAGGIESPVSAEVAVTVPSSAASGVVFLPLVQRAR